MSEDLAAAAQEYALLGWPVFPCAPAGKAPLTRNGFRDATVDLDVIDRWWRRWPAANIGATSGVVVDVIDVDSPEGLAVLTERAKGRPLGWGPVARTGRGWHYYLASAGRRSRIRMLPGVDLKAADAYVIVPPSVHPNGRRYQWFQDAGPRYRTPQPAPGWLAELLEPPAVISGLRVAPLLPEGRSTGEHVHYALAGLRAEAQAVANAPEGCRNDTLNVAAFKMRRFVEAGHLHPGDVVGMLAAAAASAGLPVREAEATIRSGLGIGL